MKKISLLFLLPIFIMGYSFLSKNSKTIVYITKYKTNHLLNANGSPAGRTGAPGEANCSSCHTGNLTQNSTTNSLQVMKDGVEVSEYVPNTTYDVFLTINNSAVKKGFQSTARIVSSNLTAGQLQAISPSTAYLTSGAKQYINHTSSSNQSTLPFQFKWTAPNDNVGEIKFYIASCISNNNGHDSGDNIHLSQHSLNYNILSPNIEFNTQNINICENEQILFNNYSTQGSNLTYLWTFEGGTPVSSTDEFPLITYNQAGSYQVSVSVSNSLGTITKNISNMVNVNSCSGLEENNNAPRIINDNIKKEIQVIYKDENIKIKINNIEGKEIYKTNNSDKISTNKWKNGIYFIEITKGNKIWIKKIIIE